METRALFVYRQDLAGYQLSPEHPFRPERLELTRSLLQSCELLPAEREVAPPPFDAAELSRIHSAGYLEAVRAASRGAWRSEHLLRHGLGSGDNPVFSGMHEAILGVVGATAYAAELVARGRTRRALSLSGGLHHALADRASGFCLYNDLALAIERLVRLHGLRVAYLDLDAHHGDGVQWLFYPDPRVMTISLHQDGRTLFPGSGHIDELGEGAARGTSVNVPLVPHSGDADFLDAFERVVPAALDAFEPDLLLLQAGADMHRYDPLATLDVSVDAMRASYMLAVELADSHCAGRLVATGGGGYDPYRTVPRAWGHLWAAVADRALPAEIPEAWRARWQPASDVILPSHTLEGDDAWPEHPDAARIAAVNSRTVDRLLAQIEPLWRGGAFRA